MNPIAAVQSRINDIESRLGIGRRVGMDTTAGSSVTAAGSSVTASGSGAGVIGTGSTTGVSGQRFATALASAGTARTPGGSGADVVTAATRYLGVPYRWGGTDPATGLDCSGLVQRVFADLGIEVPRVVADQSRAGRPVASLAQAQPGDLLVWRGSPNHIGIYVGDGKMLHAPKTGDVVKIGNVRSAPPDTIRRVIGAVGGGPGALGGGPGTVGGGPGAGGLAAGEVGSRAVGITPAAAGGSAVPFGSLFAAAEQRYSLPSGLLGAVARQESGFDPDAVSPAGAVGLMQFMPGTAAELGIDPRNPVQAVDGAGRYLRQHLDSFGSLPLALAAYNAGPGAVRSAGGIPPYAETTAYVRSILSTMPGGSL